MAELKARTDARVAIHELDAPVGQHPQKGGFARMALYRLLRVRPIAPDLRLRDGDTIGGLKVIHVARHTAGSMALASDDGVVFSGDALRSDKHGNIRQPDPRLALDPAQASVSAELIKARHAGLLLAGHGAAVSA